MVEPGRAWWSVGGARWSAVSDFRPLDAPRQRSSLHVKAFIAGNAALALALLVLLITSFVRIASGHTPPSMQRASSGHSIVYLLYTWVRASCGDLRKNAGRTFTPPCAAAAPPPPPD